MNIYNADIHTEILAEWQGRSQHSDQAFFHDGVIDAKKWSDARVKILFLNKEAHDSNSSTSEGFDLTELIREKLNYKTYGLTYRNTALWAYAIHEAIKSGAEGLPRWDKIQKDPSDNIEEAFCSCAIANIKKSAGKTHSNPKDLMIYVKNDADLLRRQIDVIDPDLIIAGYVWYLIKDYFPECEELFDCVYRYNKTIIVDFWHPSNRADEQMKYYALDALLRGSSALAKIR